MSNNLDPTNISALQFNLESAKTMASIYEPLLKKELGIVTFTYCRTFNNGTRLYLCSCSEWVKHYIEQKFQDDISHQASYTPADNISYSLWTGFKNDNIYDSLRERFDLWNGLCLYERHEDYIDYFDFSAHTDYSQSINYCINNIDKLLMLIKDFKKNAAELIDPTDKKKLMVSKSWNLFNEVSKNSLLAPNKTKKFLDQTKLKKVFFSSPT